ncbi:MAG TPA: phage tail protein [Xanthobacteraceae bacterium]|nr:phage tail protein [Xanthobacteraceae bacterium]
MPYNGSGTYILSDTIQPATPGDALEVQAILDDIATALNTAFCRDGQASMSAPLKLAAGSVSAPSLTFAADTDSGIYRIAADNLGIAVNGSKVVDVSAAGATVTGAVDATTIKQGGSVLIPPGVVMPYAGTSEPSGWLFCYGQAVSRTTYAALFSAIGTTYGAGDGSTTFNLPDLRGRTVAGKDNMGGTSADRLTNQSGGLDGDVLGASGQRPKRG